MMDRRDFLQAGLAVGCAGVGCLVLSGCDTQVGAAVKQTKQGTGLTAGRWALVIDVEKFKTDGDIEAIAAACHKAHNVPKIPDPTQAVKWIWGEDFESAFTETERRLSSVKEAASLKLPMLCNHCETPACATVCPTQATFKREDGIVEMDYHRCIGCRFCMAACPYDARSFNFVDPRPYIEEVAPEFPTRTDGVVEKCNLCVERLTQGLQPLCVEASNGSMLLLDLDEPSSERDRLFGEGEIVSRQELGVNPSVRYRFKGGK
jgi:molybdopterin-containing oxidoreductase family iron-sulfur binding subunit